MFKRLDQRFSYNTVLYLNESTHMSCSSTFQLLFYLLISIDFLIIIQADDFVRRRRYCDHFVWLC